MCVYVCVCVCVSMWVSVCLWGIWIHSCYSHPYHHYPPPPHSFSSLLVSSRLLSSHLFSSLHFTSHQSAGEETADPTPHTAHGLKGVEALILDYHVGWPVSLVLSRRAITKYQLLSRLLYFR